MMAYHPAELSQRRPLRPHSTQSRHHANVPRDLLPQPLRPFSSGAAVREGTVGLGTSKLARRSLSPGGKTSAVSSSWPAATVPRSVDGLIRSVGLVTRFKRSIQRRPRTTGSGGPPAAERLLEVDLAGLDTAASSLPRTRIVDFVRSQGERGPDGEEELLLAWPVAVPGRDSMGLLEVSLRCEEYCESLLVRVRHRSSLLFEKWLGVDEVLAIAGEAARRQPFAGGEAASVKQLLTHLYDGSSPFRR